MTRLVRLISLPVLGCAALLAAHEVLLGQSPSPDLPPAAQEEAPPLPAPGFAPLELYAGVWKVTEEHFDAGGKSVAFVEGREEIAWILDNHAIQRRYTTSTETATYRAEGTLTFNVVADRFQGSWYDNVSVSGPKVVRSEWKPDVRTMVHTIEASAKTGPEKFEVIEKFLDDATREATTFQVAGERVRKLLVVRYKRTSACPSSATFRRYFGG